MKFKLALALIVTMGLAAIGIGSANAQYPVYHNYYGGVHNYNRGPSYPYAWGPYGNYGYNPYVGSAGYAYYYRQQTNIYPTPLVGFNYGYGYGYRPYGYNSSLFLQYGRGW